MKIHHEDMIGRYWEPQPDAEDQARMEAEYEELIRNGQEPEMDELPFE